MSMLSTWRRAAAATLAAGFAALLLSACVISSTAPLVPPEEAAAVLDAGFPFVTYDGTGPYAPSEEQGIGAFTKAADSNVYADPTGAMKVSFVPRDDGRNLIAVQSVTESGETGYLYGLATVRDGIMAIEIVLAADPADDLAAAGMTVPAGATIDGGAITVTDRAGLDAVIELVANGTIRAEPLIAWVGAGEPPATIVADGDWYKAE